MRFWIDTLTRLTGGPSRRTNINTLRTIGGRYKPERFIAAGGSSVVFLAEDLTLRRLVAIKVLLPALRAHTGTQRFLRELRVVSRLQHPYILPVLDSLDADGVLGYVMPYVHGLTVCELIERQGPLPFDEALSIVSAVGDALNYAHDCGVLHRDVKPQNILVGGGHSYLLDFGVSLVPSSCTRGGRLTGRGSCVGTSYYMSPEQASGQDMVDHRTDQYSLACVLYEMLSGRPPFEGNDRQIMSKHITEPVPPITRVRSDIPRVACRAISQALSKAPADRFDSTLDFVARLNPPETPPTTGVTLPSSSGTSISLDS